MRSNLAASEKPVNHVRNLRGIIAEQGCLSRNCDGSGDGGLRRWSSITCEFVSAWPYRAARGRFVLLRTPCDRISRANRCRGAGGDLSAADRRDCHRPPGRNELKPRGAGGQLSERERCQSDRARRWPKL